MRMGVICCELQWLAALRAALMLLWDLSVLLWPLLSYKQVVCSDCHPVSSVRRYDCMLQD